MFPIQPAAPVYHFNNIEAKLLENESFKKLPQAKDLAKEIASTFQYRVQVSLRTYYICCLFKRTIEVPLYQLLAFTEDELEPKVRALLVQRISVEMLESIQAAVMQVFHENRSEICL